MKIKFIRLFLPMTPSGGKFYNMERQQVISGMSFTKFKPDCMFTSLPCVWHQF